MWGLWWAREILARLAEEGHRAVQRSGLVLAAIRIGDRHARLVAARVEARELRLLALRSEADADEAASFGQDLLVMPWRSWEEPEENGLTFYAVREDGVREVEIFLDDRLVKELCEYEPTTWQGVIEYIEEDLQNGFP